jgi:GT2 family glycosyltransferase
VETFVVDNGSPRFDVERQRAARPDVTWIANPDNRGFAVASNQPCGWRRVATRCC